MLRVALMVSAGCVLGWGCLPADNLPNPFNPPPASCGNGVCDLSVEDCNNCPSECRCCVAVSSLGSDEGLINPDSVLGPSDGNSASLDAQTSLILVVGREITDAGSDFVPITDFTLVGKVTSGSPVSQVGTCAADAAGSGAFEISISLDGDAFCPVGLWALNNNTFDLGCARNFDACAELRAARFVRIDGQDGAAGELDALEAQSCIP